MERSILLYGAYGYTARLLIEEYAPDGAPLTLAGRDATKLAEVAAGRGFPQRAFDLADERVIERELDGVGVVLNCAGPFARTALPLARACIRRGVHYLDITGEIEVFEALAALDGPARAANVMLMPGSGFDVVPTDCMAAHLRARLPEAQRLQLAFKGLSRVSRGTATTAIENLDQGGMIRRDGELVRVPPAHRQRQVDLGSGPETVVTIPWGDVATAWHTTGIPNIETYTVVPPRLVPLMRSSRWFGWLLASAPAQSLLKAWLQRQPAGPSSAQRARGGAVVWGEACDGAGRCVQSRLHTPNAYSLTGWSAWTLASRALAGHVEPGYQTPARVHGADFILECDGVSRVDLD
ncbi:MAG: saccharopine dehydrogenase NADP-binding domain-containing protein [Pseudomonadota bacterium]|nr:saccharopine dehydrogenase NADP-binding domain-containing protein [Pseudomonadota bacterium]HJO36024.1 saccharopine dehydrogenase NADP-binding domain-containing protein [Gammaproteobacteria bacterium]